MRQLISNVHEGEFHRKKRKSNSNKGMAENIHNNYQNHFRTYLTCLQVEFQCTALYKSFFPCVLLDFSLTVKAATLIFISGCGSAISSAKEGKSSFIYNLINS